MSGRGKTIRVDEALDELLEDLARESGESKRLASKKVAQYVKKERQEKDSMFRWF